MIKLTAVALLLALPAAAQDEKDVTRRISELSKQLSSRDEGERIAAIRELGDIHHAKSRLLLAKRLVTDTADVRLAAADAIIRHRNDTAAKALGNGIQAARGDRKLITAFIKALGDLDNCAGIPILVGVMQQDSGLAKPCLDAINRIGCVEAAPGMIKTLGLAEKEAKKPDRFADVGAVNDRNRRGRRPNDRQNDRNRGGTDNPNKDKDLAALVKPVSDALKKLTGKSFKGHDGWLQGAASGALSRRQVRVYYCEHAKKTFEVPSSGRVTCPFDGAPRRHDDHFQKHK